MDGEVFINYRGEDGRSYAALLYVEVSRQFSADRVFLDSESIPAGADYTKYLLCRVRRAYTVLAIIGPSWLGAINHGRWRIRKVPSWTERELVEAFNAGIRVIPVLTDDTTMPTERQLPHCLAPLSRCQYRRLRCRDATADLHRIITDLTAPESEALSAAALIAAATQCPPRPATRGAAATAPTIQADHDPTAELYQTLVVGRRRCRPP